MLDSDMLVLQNMDELLDMDLKPGHIAAAHVCACNPRKIPHYPSDWCVIECSNSFHSVSLANHTLGYHRIVLTTTRGNLPRKPHQARVLMGLSIQDWLPFVLQRQTWGKSKTSYLTHHRLRTSSSLIRISSQKSTKANGLHYPGIITLSRPYG